MRAQVTQALGARKVTLIVDCRSSTYKGVWAPPHSKTVEIRIFTQVDGVKKVITHMSKKTRGEVTRLLLQGKSIPTNPQELQAAISLAFHCELIAPTDIAPGILEVIF